MAEIKSETHGVTITAWDEHQFSWRNEYGDSATVHRYNEPPEVLVSGHTPVRVPAELARFLAGEGPPPPPIEEGDTVTRGGSSREFKVLAVHGDAAWVHYNPGYATISLSNLRLVEKAKP